MLKIILLVLALVAVNIPHSSCYNMPNVPTKGSK